MLDGHNYTFNFFSQPGIVAAGNTLTIDGSALSAGFRLFAVGNLVDGHLVFIGGAGNDQFEGGKSSDTFTGGGGVDQFVFNLVIDSTSTTYDTITDLNFGVDFLGLDAGTYGPSAIDPAVTSGALSAGAAFDADLAAAVNAGALHTQDALLYTPDSGSLASHTFLIVDQNGIAGYQAGADYVIDVTGYSGALTTLSFTAI